MRQSTRQARGTALLIAVVMGVCARAEAAAPLGPTRASELVQLIWSGASCVQGGKALDVNFNAGQSSPFEVPDGKVLVLTDVSWSAYNAAPNGFAFAALLLETGPYELGFQWIHARADANGRVGDQSRLPNLVLKPGSRLCASFSYGVANLESIAVSGYLTRDR